ncbi:MAG: cytochrome c3 family protein [Planctomycetota bacterium]
MTVLFPKWTNKLPAMLALGAAATGLFVVFVVSFWFSPKSTDVGYQPYQPISYSHKLHAGALGMDCRYCHRMVEEGPNATVPDADTCYGCHKVVLKDSPQLTLLHKNYGEGKADGPPIEWVKVHLLPQYAYFDHAVHMRGRIGCTSCHGRVDEMDIVHQVEPLSMGWCIECHRDPSAHIRPDGVSVTQMNWTADDKSMAAAKKRLEWTGETPPEFSPPTHCSACHR